MYGGLKNAILYLFGFCLKRIGKVPYGTECGAREDEEGGGGPVVTRHFGVKEVIRLDERLQVSDGHEKRAVQYALQME